MRFLLIPILAGASTIDPTLTMADAIAQMNTLPPSGLHIDTTLWKSVQEKWSESDFFTLTPLYKKRNTGVYEYGGDGIIYRQYCPNESDLVNPILADYWFQKYLENTTLVAHVNAVSDPILATDLLDSDICNSGSFQELMDSPEIVKKLTGKIPINSCGPNAPDTVPEIRFTLMAKVPGVPIGDYLYPEGLPLAQAVAVGKLMVRGLAELHAHNVIHGDAQTRNFIFDPTTGTVKMINFGRSRIFNQKEIQKAKCGIVYENPEKISRSVWNSPWESRLCVSSYRDDLYHALIGIAMLMHGMDYVRYWNTISGDAFDLDQKVDKKATSVFRSVWWEQRSEGSIFNVQGLKSKKTSERISNYPKKDDFLVRNIVKNANLKQISNQLQLLEQYTIRLEIDQRPNYELILGTLNSIQDLAKP